MKPGERAEIPLPNKAYITPSNINPWRGGRAEGARWTRSQLRQLEARGIDPAGAEGMMVRSVATERDMWWPKTELAPVFVFECPVLGRRADGRVRVISPAGMVKLVNADGSIRSESRSHVR